MARDTIKTHQNNTFIHHSHLYISLSLTTWRWLFLLFIFFSIFFFEKKLRITYRLVSVHFTATNKSLVGEEDNNNKKKRQFQSTFDHRLSHILDGLSICTIKKNLIRANDRDRNTLAIHMWNVKYNMFFVFILEQS